MLDLGGSFHALSIVDPLFRVPPDRSRPAISLLELFAAGIPRVDIASAWISVLTSYNAGICVDGEFETSHSGR